MKYRFDVLFVMHGALKDSNYVNFPTPNPLKLELIWIRSEAVFLTAIIPFPDLPFRAMWVIEDDYVDGARLPSLTL